MYNSLKPEHIQVTRMGHLALSNFEHIRHVCFSTDDMMILILARFLERHKWDPRLFSGVRGLVFYGNALKIYFTTRGDNMQLVELAESLVTRSGLADEYPTPNAPHIFSRVLNGQFRPFANLTAHTFRPIETGNGQISSFTAPEMALNGFCVSASDFWSLGAIFWRFFYSSDLFEFNVGSPSKADYQARYSSFQISRYQSRNLSKMSKAQQCLFLTLTQRNPLSRSEQTTYQKMAKSQFLRNVLFKDILKCEYGFFPFLDFDGLSKDVMVITRSTFLKNESFLEKVQSRTLKGLDFGSGIEGSSRLHQHTRSDNHKNDKIGNRKSSFLDTIRKVRTKYKI